MQYRSITVSGARSRDAKRVRRIIRHLLASGDVGEKGERLACLSHIVSRREYGASAILQERGLEAAFRLGARTLNELAEGKWDQHGDKDRRSLFRYAMLLLGGLCRVRLLENDVFPPGEKMAGEGVAALERAAKEKWVLAQEATAGAATKIVEYLNGRGTSPGLLKQIDSLSG